jgi:hypothetical protein
MAFDAAKYPERHMMAYPRSIHVLMARWRRALFQWSKEPPYYFSSACNLDLVRVAQYPSTLHPTAYYVKSTKITCALLN